MFPLPLALFALQDAPRRPPPSPHPLDPEAAWRIALVLLTLPNALVLLHLFLSAVDVDVPVAILAGSVFVTFPLAVRCVLRSLWVQGGGVMGRGEGGGRRGVSNEAKREWERWVWGADTVEVDEEPAEGSSSVGMSDYGSMDSRIAMPPDGAEECENAVPDLEGGWGPMQRIADEEEQPSCSICLCDYDLGEEVVRLPCTHLYHEACIGSWTDNHTRCPLCNFDLMEGRKPSAVG